MTEHEQIIFTRHRGRGITIDHAPTHTRLDPRVLADRNTYLRMPTPDTIVFADQVVYRITSFDGSALLLELVEDWRPATTPPASEPAPSDPAAAYQALRERWQQTHGNGEPPRVVTRVEAKEESGA